MLYPQVKQGFHYADEDYREEPYCEEDHWGWSDEYEEEMGLLDYELGSEEAYNYFCGDDDWADIEPPDAF